MRLFVILLIPLLFTFQISHAQQWNKHFVAQVAENVVIDYVGLKSDSTIPNGAFKIHVDGNILINGKFIHGVRDGKWTRYYPDRSKHIEAFYVMGKKQGNWTYYNDRGDILAKIQFQDDKNIGHWKGYYPEGSLATEIEFDNNSIPVKTTYYYRNGNIVGRIEQEESNDGIYKNESYYYENQQLAIFKQTLNDSLHGKYILYHKTGARWEELIFKKGKLVRAQYMASEYGNPRKFGDVRNGSGTLYRYNMHGELFSKSYFKNGILHDSAKIYQKGKIIYKALFNHGKPVGKWKVYNKYYILRQINDYSFKGDTIKTKYVLSKQDNEKYMGHYINNFKSGEWEWYNMYNEITSRMTYDSNFLNGPAYRYEGKILRSEGEYKWGQKVGEWKYYNTWEKEVEREFYPDSVSMDNSLFQVAPKGYFHFKNFNFQFGGGFRYFSKDAIKTYRYTFKRPPGIQLIDANKLIFDRSNWFLQKELETKLNYKPFFVPPLFPGGTRKEERFVRDHLQYTLLGKVMEISGYNMVQFHVDEFGFPTDYKMIKRIGFGQDKTSMDVIKIMPFFEPAMFNGIPLGTYIIKEIYYPKKS